MTLSKDRQIGRYVHSDGLVTEPSTIAGAEVLPDGQIQPVTDWPGINLAVRDTDLVPAVHVDTRSRTAERITMNMSPTGQSPAAGTTVTTQAEYDALGHDLLYPDDVFAILPRVIEHAVIVGMDPGVYSGKPNNLEPTFGWAASIKLPQDMQTIMGKFDFTDFDHINPGIYFEGSQSVEVAAQSGTVLAGGLVEVTGAGWTPDAYQGKLIRFVTGANAGQTTSIGGNTSDTLELLYPWTTGACTFEIVVPAVKFDGNDYYAIIGRTGGRSGSFLYFNDVQFGDDTTPCASMAIHGATIVMTNCVVNTENGIDVCVFEGQFPGSLRIADGVVKLTGALFGVRVGRWGDIGGSRCMLYGDVTTAGPNNSLLEINSGNCGFYTTQIEALAAHGSDPLVEVRGVTQFQVADLDIRGNGSGDGMTVIGVMSLDAGPTGSGGVAISGCDVGINVDGGKVVITSNMNASVSDNTIGIELSNGADLVIGVPQNIGATTTDISIDGVAHPYSDLDSGDSITGVNGSRITRR